MAVEGCGRTRRSRKVTPSPESARTKAKAQTLRWLGHLLKMGEDRCVKKAYLGIPNDRRARHRWNEAVADSDLRKIQVANWHKTQRGTVIGGVLNLMMCM